MEVQSLLAAIEAINDDVHSISIGALQHAAEISPYVTERTLGADLEPFEVEADKSVDLENVNNSCLTPTPDKNKSNETAEVNSSTHSVTPTNVPSALNTSISQSSLNLSSLQNLDLQTIMDSVRLREAEVQRRAKVRKSVIELQQKYEEVITKQTEMKEEILEAAHNDWLEKKQKSEDSIRLQSEQKAEEELTQASSKLNDLLNKTQRHLFSIFFQGIVQYQKRFRLHYETITKMLKPADTKAEYNNKMKQLVQMFDQLIMRIKGNGCGLAELQVAEKLCLALESVEQSLLSDIRIAEKEQKEQETQEIIKQQEQQKQEQQKQAQFEQEQKQQAELKQQQQQQERLKKQESQQEQQQQQQEQQQTQQIQQQPQQIIDSNVIGVVAASPKVPPSVVSDERLKFYTHITEFYQEKVERVKPLQADESLKKFRFAIQKAINIPVNAISAFSAQHLRDKFDKLISLLMGQMIKNPEGQFSTNDHPLGRDYCLLLMAKKFVSQGDSVISSNPQAAFPVASIIVSLWKAVPDFGKIFLAYTFKESPFLVPYFIPQAPGLSMEEYLKVLGYRIIDKKPESQDMFLKRQAGIARLYAAVMVTGSATQFNVAPHPYGIQHAWRWITNFVELEPWQDICATIMQEVLQNAGFELWRTYGKQFVKLLIYLQKVYFPKLSAVDKGGPNARLELLLDKYLKEGQIPQPQGLLPAGFW